MHNKIFTQREVNLIFSHLSARTILSWNEKGILTLSSAGHDGRGKIRTYTKENLYELALLEELASLNVPLIVISWLLINIKKAYRPISSEKNNFLVILKHEYGFKGLQDNSLLIPQIFSLEELQDKLEELRNYPGAIIVSLTEIYNRVEQLIKKAGFS